MNRVLIKEMVAMIIKYNGKGHAELEKRVESGEISEEDAVRIKVRAQVELLNSKLDSLLQDC